MSLGIECLLTEDAALAREMAAQLDGMNQDRNPSSRACSAKRWLSSRICRWIPCRFWSVRSRVASGVIGILASRMKDALFFPTIAAADARRVLKGSGRSVRLPFAMP
jgi:single-stranded-DNA-specific exonuclease